ncbi:hypothetical protein PSI23_10215 [Xenorhabdus sp. XENO-10]|uniref:Uncharacterized protein n=1 Tax=Xenorhabdus yunnanensis TaxID=3025878 RepID=A0ABT5LEX2_9GAMM|nr:hypothetical protein [Xenorhabdus yunnanensis]MDC9589660.1 hypothetical protein [Xenorhabdus yunnanensis]
MREIFYKSVINPAKKYSMSLLEIQYRDLVIDASRYLIKSASPNIIHSLKIDDNNFYYEFISWCYENDEHTDWRIGVSLVKYLNKINLSVGTKIKEELLFLSC